MVDIHAHILPFLDDGPKSWKESIEMCRIAQECGITHIVATPHFIMGYYTKVVSEGRKLLEELKKRLKDNGIQLKVFLGAEIEPFPELPRWVEEKRLPIFPSGKHVLVETPFSVFPFWIKEVIHDIKLMGITPILAHPERCTAINLKNLEKVIEAGAEVQIDAESILGIWGIKAEKNAWEMMENNFVTYIASDAHRARHRSPELLRKAREIVKKRFSEKLAELLTRENPLKTINTTSW